MRSVKKYHILRSHDFECLRFVLQLLYLGNGLSWILIYFRRSWSLYVLHSTNRDGLKPTLTSGNWFHLDP